MHNILLDWKIIIGDRISILFLISGNKNPLRNTNFSSNFFFCPQNREIKGKKHNPLVTEAILGVVWGCGGNGCPIKG